jgi:hypothetical protein
MLLIYLTSLLLNAQDVSAPAANTLSIKGTPRIIRSSGVNGTEIFFSDLEKSYFIPVDSQHNSKFEIFNKAIAAKKAVSFQADAVSRSIFAVEGLQKKSLSNSTDEEDVPTEKAAVKAAGKAENTTSKNNSSSGAGPNR